MRQFLRLGATATLQRLVNPEYSSNVTHRMTQEIVRSEEQRALNGIVSDLSAFPRIQKCERGALMIEMAEDQAETLSADLELTPKKLQDERMKNIGMMALKRFLVSNTKGKGGLTGGKNSVVLEYSRMCATPSVSTDGDNTVFETVVFVCLQSAGGADANFRALLEKESWPVKKNLVVATARIVKGAILDTRFSFTGIDYSFLFHRWLQYGTQAREEYPSSTISLPSLLIEIN